MSTKNLLSFARDIISLQTHQIQNTVSALAVDAVDVLLGRDCDLADLLAQFDLWPTAQSHELENTAEGWLFLARYEMSSNSVGIDLVLKHFIYLYSIKTNTLFV